MESKLLQLFDSVSERFDQYYIESYKSIGVSYNKLGKAHRTQIMDSIVTEHGLDYLNRPEHVFSRIVHKYVYVQKIQNVQGIEGNKDTEGNKRNGSFVSFTGKAINNFLYTDDEIIVTQYRKVLSAELAHKVLFENSKKNASFGSTLGNILEIIKDRLMVDTDIFSDRMINTILQRNIEDTSEIKYDIVSEIEYLFDPLGPGRDRAVNRILRYYKNCIEGTQDTLWIIMPPKDMKIRDLFNAINLGLFGPDAELVERSGYGNYLSGSVASRYGLNAIFGNTFGPIGPMIIQNRMYDKGIIDAIQLTSCMFVCPMPADDGSIWSSVDHLEVPDTIGYKLPRATQGKKFTANEIYAFVDFLRDL